MEDATYHQRMSARTAAKIKLLRSHWKAMGTTCLDIGAGRGDITKALWNDGAEYIDVIELSNSFSVELDGIKHIGHDVVKTKLDDYGYNITLCLSVMHHVIGHHGWDVAMETWKRILAASEVVYFEIGLPSEHGQFYWKDAMKGMDDEDVRKRFTLNARIMYWEQIGALPIHGIERPIYYLRRL